MDDQLLIIGCTFLAVTSASYFVAQLLTNREGKQIRNRLSMRQQSRVARPRATGILSFLQRMGQAAAEPFMPKSREKQSGLRQNLARAGIYSPSAARVMTGSKVILMFAGVVGGYLAGIAWDMPMLGLSLGGIVGYLLPTLWLRAQIKSNQRSLTYGLADALDLLVVCVEAGLTIDSALQRVGQELVLAHP